MLEIQVYDIIKDQSYITFSNQLHKIFKKQRGKMPRLAHGKIATGPGMTYLARDWLYPLGRDHK